MFITDSLNMWWTSAYFILPFTCCGIIILHLSLKSSRNRHRVLAMATLDKSLSIVWWRWHSASQLLLMLIYGSLFLSSICYCLSVFWCATASMLQLELEQWTNIKFLVKLGKSGNETREMLVQVYGENALKKTSVYKWVKRLSEGRKSVTDGQHQAELKKTLQKFVKFRMKIVGWLSGA